MTAEEYLKGISQIKYQLNVLDREREQIRNMIYSVKGVDYVKTRTGSKTSDIADKIERVERLTRKINEQEIRLLNTYEEARIRIEDIGDNFYSSFLIDYYLNGVTLDTFEEIFHYSRSRIYEIKKKSIELFGETHENWLSSLDKLN